MRTGLLVSALVASTLVAGCDPEPFTLVVSMRDNALAAYRDGDGAWKPLEVEVEVEGGRARIPISSGRYSLAWICSGPLASYVVHSTLADEPLAHCSAKEGSFSRLTGTTSPNARVYVGGVGTSADSAGGYFATTSPGYHDVVAISADTPARILIRRDVDLRTDQQLDLPVAEEGSELRSVQPSVTGSPQSIELGSQLRLRSDEVVAFPSGGELVALAPADALVDGEVQIVRAVGERLETPNGFVRCLAQRTAGDDTPQIHIPDAPTVTVERTRVRTPSDDTWRYLRFEARTTRGLYTVSATRGWMDEADTDAVEIPDLSLLPGFSWDLLHITLRERVNWTVYTEHGEHRSTFSACTTEDSMTW